MSEGKKFEATEAKPKLAPVDVDGVAGGVYKVTSQWKAQCPFCGETTTLLGNGQGTVKCSSCKKEWKG